MNWDRERRLKNLHLKRETVELETVYTGGRRENFLFAMTEDPRRTQKPSTQGDREGRKRRSWCHNVSTFPPCKGSCETSTRHVSDVLVTTGRTENKKKHK